ncbi:hypothetical protein [Rubrobacter indicoceani]|uniref:hypothetical protein n=1 Tax=Rubrobacter indicoceani TaxID=2051957 RepID=UPI000E5BB59B|nr:hypothetical protein [Rubrobacter indicoceani]
MRKLRLVRGSDAGEKLGVAEDSGYERKPLEAPLTITPPVLNGSGYSGYSTEAAPETFKPVKKINTLTPPETTLQRTEESERSHRWDSLRKSRSRVRQSNREKLYRRRRKVAMGLGGGLVVAVVLTALVLFLGARSEAEAVAINPGAAADTIIAEVGDISLSTPVRPEALNGLGYHAEGEQFTQMEPRGRNLGSVFAFVPFGSTPEKLGYYVMSDAGRGGPDTGAVDVGAEAGTEVFSPVTGLVTAIRPDPKVAGASVVEIQPTENPDLRVYVTLVGSQSGSAGVKSPVEAGKTKLGTVADSARVLDPQLADYTGQDGNHVTVFTASPG